MNDLGEILGQYIYDLGEILGHYVCMI